MRSNIVHQRHLTSVSFASDFWHLEFRPNAALTITHDHDNNSKKERNWFLVLLWCLLRLEVHPRSSTEPLHILDVLDFHFPSTTSKTTIKFAKDRSQTRIMHPPPSWLDVGHSHTSAPAINEWICAVIVEPVLSVGAVFATGVMSACHSR